MTGNELRGALHEGTYVYGTLIVSTSPHWVQAVQSLHLDFVFIDTEHIAIERQTLSWMCQAYKGIGVAPLVRIPSPDPYQACMVLDGGASGVIVPYVETPEQVEKLAGALKLRPLKGRRLEENLGTRKNLEPELAEYLTKNNRENVFIVNIESVPAVEALDEILSVPGLDGVLIGPHDLSCSLGIAEQYFDPKFESTLETIIRKARNRNVGVGIHMFYPDAIDQEIRLAKLGANLILHSADIIAFRTAIGADMQKIKSSLGTKQTGEAPGAINI